MENTVSRYLALARNALGMDLAWLSEVSGSEQVLRVMDGDGEPFDLTQGEALAMEGSFCIRVLDERLPKAVPDTRANPVTASLPATERFGIGAYVGQPVHLPGGGLYGMLCCISRHPHREVKEHHMRLLAALASSLGHELADEGSKERPDSVPHRILDAIEGRGLQIVVQPIVDLATMQVTGVEALTRFDGPPAGPDQWFAEATELGLGTLLEMTAVHAALDLLPQLPPDLYLSINASPATVDTDDFMQALSVVDGSRIVIELTEHTSVVDYFSLLARIDRLRRTGVRIAVDDAGAGYASFRHILALLPDIIKFDRNLISGIDVDPAREALVEALASFAARIEAELVAEGIENSGELTSLARLGVTCGQGYHLARPAPLPVPAIDVRPHALRHMDNGGVEAPGPHAGLSLEEALAAILREVLARTRLEASYLNLLDAERELLEHWIVHDPQQLGVVQGRSTRWHESPCYQCRASGILWTADVENDLPGAVVPPDVRTFISMPLRDGQGELIGTICAAGRLRRYLSDPLVQHLQRLAADASTLMSRARHGA